MGLAGATYQLVTNGSGLRAWMLRSHYLSLRAKAWMDAERVKGAVTLWKGKGGRWSGGAAAAVASFLKEWEGWGRGASLKVSTGVTYPQDLNRPLGKQFRSE